MKIYISYFYKVRFMKPNTIALSTAMYDPKWFHEFKSQNHLFIDKNGVVNGLRMSSFVPIHHEESDGYCGHCDKDNSKCLFMKQYREQLSKLNVSDVIRYLELIANKFNSTDDEPEIILLVHEAPNNPCSERVPITEWFESHNINIEEWSEK